MKEAIPMGMYLALPGQAAGGEKIVDILSPEEIETVEVYCSNAAAPLELRDAAETAEMLGHSDTKSVHKYTSLDTERMRLCPLSLSETGLSMDERYGHE